MSVIKTIEKDRETNERLVQTIRAYWERRGFDVEVDIETGGFDKVNRAAIISIRSDMVNGFPVRRTRG
mgnify:CR=1 FL=1